MSSLTDIISQAKQGVQLQVKGAQNQLTSGVTGAVSNAKNNIVTGITTISHAAISGGINAVVGAAGQALLGNFSGAATTLESAGSNLVNTVSTVTGISFGSSLSDNSGISYSSQPSSNGGVTPGDPFGGINARPDPVLAFNWYTELPMIIPAAGTAASLPWYYVEEVNLPQRTVEVRSIFREGRNKHFPGSYSIDPLRLTIYADINNNAISYIEAWRGLVLNPTTSANAASYGGGYGQASKFQKSIKTFVLAADKSTLVEFEYTECWPISVESVNLISGNTERVVWHVGFSVGDVFATIYNLSNSANSGFLGTSGVVPTIQQTVGAVYSSLTGAATSAIKSLF